MRQIVLDTETTGLSPSDGHKIIEIGCVELNERRLTKRNFHIYLNPERQIEAGAMAVHGISNEFLEDKPIFFDIVEEFLAFVRGAELIIHNAPFDVGFINHEMAIVDRALGTITDYCTVLDTLALARSLHPGQRNTLDALCKRYQIDNSDRTLHGALLDAKILSQVYLVMTTGQGTLFDDGDGDSAASDSEVSLASTSVTTTRIIPVSEQEANAHAAYLQRMEESTGVKPLWEE